MMSSSKGGDQSPPPDTPDAGFAIPPVAARDQTDSTELISKLSENIARLENNLSSEKEARSLQKETKLRKGDSKPP